MHSHDKIIRVFLVIVFLFYNTPVISASAATIFSFSDFNQELINLDSAYWDLSSMEIIDDSLHMTGSEATANYVLDVTSIAQAINQGELEINFAANASIDDEAADALDQASITVGFGSDSASPATTFVLNRGVDNPGTSVTLTSSESIPAGTNYIFIQPASIGQGTQNSTVFSSISLTINDLQNPTLEYSLSPSGWTNTNVEITLTASDGDSGIEGIYNAENEKISSTNTYSFSTSGNDTWIFTAKDYAGKISDELTVIVNGIDQSIPAIPVLLVETSEWTNQKVGFTISENTIGEGEAPESPQYRLNSGDWQTYTEPAYVELEGQSSLEARIVDEAGNTSDIVSSVVKMDLSAPQINLSSAAHPYPTNGATITAMISDSYTSIAEKKYTSGSQTAEFFTTSGNSFTGDTFDISTGGTYTVYAIDQVGNSAVSEITVNTYPTLDSITEQSMEEDGSLSLVFSISDDQTSTNNLIVTANSTNNALFQNLAPINDNGSVSLLLAPEENQNGSSEITVSVRDSEGLVSSSTFTVTVNAVNDAPSATDDTASTDEDTPVTMEVLGNDTDIDSGDVFTITGTSGVTHGSVEIISDGTQLRFTPDNNWNGSTTFTYTIEDTSQATSNANVTVTVNAVDDAPVISTIDDQTIDEDGTIEALSFSVSDPEEDGVVVTASSGNTTLVPQENINVVVLGSGNYTISISPEVNKNGITTITITADDGTKTATEDVLLTVNAVNDAPTAVADTAVTDEDTSIEIDVLTNDSDIEDEELTVTELGIASHGSIQITGSGKTVTYIPDSNYNGSDSFIYKVSDASGGSNTATVNIAVNSILDAPFAQDDTANTDEDTDVTVYPLANDGDPDIELNGDAIRITQISGELYGTVSLAEDGQSFTYSPNGNSVNRETLSYTISDLNNQTTTAMVTITINPVNDAPSAQSDNAETDEDTAVVIDVLTNDIDIDLGNEGDTLLIAGVDGVSHGSVEIISENTQLRFTPASNWNGVTSFTYTISDESETLSNASVTVTVNPVNDAPVISEIEDQTIDEDGNTGTLNFTVTDVEGDTLLVTAAGDQDALIPASTIELTDESGGNYTITITPLADQNGAAIVTITANDGTITSTETFTLTVNAVNDAPVAGTDTVSTDEDNALEISVLDNDTDVENEVLTVTAVSTAEHGSAAITGSGKTITYTPVENYNGSDSFTYTVSDATGATDTGIVNITVNSINDSPSAKADSVTLNEDVVTTIDVLANDTDIDLTTNPAYETLTIIAVSDPPHGSTAISENKVVYTPAANYFGSDSFSYTLQDTDGVQATATVNLTINSVNDYPVFSNLDTTYTVNEDESITFHFDISDVETTTESLMLQVTSLNQTVVSDSNLILEGLGDANTDTILTITPNANQNQDITIKFTLGDGFVTTQANVTLDIVPVNDDPVTVDDEYSFVEDNGITIDMDNLVTNDTDIDGDTLSFVQIVDGSLGYGTLSVLASTDHTYTYTPPTNFDEATTFQYTMTDGTVEKTGTVILTAQPVNDAPILTLDASNADNFDEDTSLTLLFTIDDYETEISKLSVQAGSSDSDLISPDNITIHRNADGTCSMTLVPGEDQNGLVTISLSLSDGVILVEKDIPLTINPIQDDPVASADSITVETGGSITFNPLENDHDPDGDAITIQSLSTTSTQGSVVNNGNDTLTYTAPVGVSGSDSFTYTINDGNYHTATATVSITISGGNTPPQITAIANQYLNEDNSTSELAFSVSDADSGSTLTVTKASSNETLIPLNSITITSTGTNTYTVKISPEANQSGSATITLTVTDDEFSTDTTSFTITVYPINDLPVAVDDSLTVNEDTTLTFTADTLIANDVDVDEGAVLQITSITNPTHGRLSYNVSSGEYSYRPNSNYNGSDSFEYTITDGEATDTATVNITISSVNDNPVAYSNWWTVEGTLGTSYNGDIRTNDYDIETSDENLTVIILTQPTYGTAVVETDGTVTYTRDTTNYSEDWKDSFTYNVQDDNVPAGTSNTATVYIDDYWGPSIYGDDQSFTMDEDNSLNMTISIHDGYGEGYIVSFATPTLGTITDADNTDKYIIYTPNENVNGSETITYTLVSNYTGNPTGSGKFYVTIYPINDAPVITPTLSDMTIDEDTTTSTIHVDISDVETSAEDLIFTVSSSNSDLVLDSGISITRDAGSIDFAITPIANRFGDTTITLLTSDKAAQTTESFTLTVSPVNDVPVADDISESTNEDNSVTITVISPNADIDGDNLTVTTPVLPEHGSLVINDDDTITYIPVLNYFGTDTFTYQLADASSSDTGQVTIIVNAINDPPEIANLVYNQNTLEDTPKTVTFTISDVDNDLSVSDVSIIADNTTLFPDGSISVSGAESAISVTLSPAANLSGSSIQTVTVTDGMYSISQNFKLTVAAVNDIPVANDDTATTDEDISVTFDVITNDTDVESGTLTVVSFVDPTNGSVINNRDGTLTYTPAANWYGTDNFTYTIADVNNGQDIATVTVTVNPVNDAPIAQKDSTTILEDTPVTINLLANDSDIEGSTLTLTGVSTPTKGTYVDNGDGSITYTPNKDQYGPESFTYTVSDGDLTSTGTVNIQITAINDAPEFSTSVDLPWTLYEDTPKSFPIKITDAETASDNLVAKITSSKPTLVPGTSITLTGSGQNKYIELSPLLNQYGTLDLTIEVSDGVNTTTDVYPVKVLSVNDLPTISSVDNQTTVEDTPTNSISFTVSDIETSASELTVTAATVDGTLIPPENVAVTNGTGGNRTVILTPAANKVGSSLVTLTVHDADSGTADESLTLTVTAVNDAPTAVADADSVDEDDSVDIDVLANDIDVDLSNEGDNLTIMSTADVDHGAVSISDDKHLLTFTPAANWNGTETFSYTMKDSVGETSSASVTVTVNAVNDSPIANDDSASASEDQAVTIEVLTNDTDIDLSREGDDLTITSTNGVDHGSVTIADDFKSITFTPETNWYGSEEFSYTITDTHNATASADVTVTVSAVNDPPVISDIANQTLTEDIPSSAISFTVSDVESDAADLLVTAATSDGTRIAVGNVLFDGSDGNRSLTITPTADKNTWNALSTTHEPVTLTITVSDGALTNSDTFTVTINPVNDGPIASDDTAITNEDTPVGIDVLVNDTDVDIANEGDNLFVTGISGVDHGTAEISADGKSITFTPAVNYYGSETFTYTVQDSHEASDTADVTITVIAVNDAPVITDIADQTIYEDTTTGEISFSISDVDSSITCSDITASSDVITIIPNSNIEIIGSVTNCSVTVTPLGNKNTYGISPVTITLTVSDGLLTNQDTFTVEILNVNDPPTAINDTATAVEDLSVEINVLNNDSDEDLVNEGDTLAVLSVADVDHGEVVIDPETSLLKFTPEANWSGTETFSYTMEDSAHVSSSANVEVTVTAANDAPQAYDDSDEVVEDHSVVISPLDNDTDIDLNLEGDALSIYSFADVDHGTVSIAEDGQSLTFTPSANWVGTEVFTYTIRDKANAESSANISVVITPVNDAPVAKDDSYTSPEDQTAILYVLTNDEDVDLDNEGDDLVILSVSGALHGTSNVDTDQKSISYVPEENWFGSETLIYYMEDKAHQVSSATISLQITPVNDPPQAVSDEGSTQEDESLNLEVLANDTDIDLGREGDTFSIVSTSNVDHGMVTIADDKQSLTFVPAANWNGTEIFIYQMKDSGDATSSASVTVHVTAVNDLPDAVDDNVTTSEDQSILIQVLSNDTDVDLLNEGDTLQITDTNGVENGSVIVSSDKTSITFTPDADWYGTEFFTYTIQDESDESDTATVTVVVTPVNDTPVAANDTYEINEDTITTLEVLDNDNDADPEDEITINAIEGVVNATVTIATDKKSLEFTPASNWNGNEEFSYTVTDITGATASATVSVQIDPINDNPQAVNDGATIDEDSSITIDVLDNDIDVDMLYEGDTLSLSTVEGMEHGSYSFVNGNQSILYTTTADWNGTETFTYTVSDSHDATSSASVTVTVIPQEDSSIAVDDTATCAEDGNVMIDVLGNDIDVDLEYGGDSLSVVSVGDVEHGTVNIATDYSSITYIPSENWNGTEIFEYTMQDADHSTSSAQVTVTVTPQNDAPVAVNDTAITNEDVSVVIDVLENDTDVDLDREGDNLLISEVSGTFSGTVNIASDGKSLTYSPPADISGTETFTYNIKDKADITSQANVTVTIQPVDDAPTISEIDNQTINEDTIAGPIAFTLSDIDSLVEDISVSATSSNPDIISDSGIVFEGNSASRTISITPILNKNTYGTSPVTITLRASSISATGTATFTLTINPVNDSPQAVADVVSMKEDTSLTFSPLANDTDVDLQNEGDNLTIIDVTDVDKATVKITEDGKKLTFKPKADWYGNEEFTYTLQDNAGVQSTATILVMVNNVPEASKKSTSTPTSITTYYPVSTPTASSQVNPTQLDLEIITPAGGEQFKDGNTVKVTWTSIPITGVTYNIDFYDGKDWETLASNVADTTYLHNLIYTKLETNTAYYRVTASLGDSTKIQAQSKPITIDNFAPRDINVHLLTSNGAAYSNDTSSDQPVEINIGEGWDLTGINLTLTDNGNEISSGTTANVEINQEGVHNIEIVATDPLGNTSVIGKYTIVIGSPSLDDMSAVISPTPNGNEESQSHPQIIMQHTGNAAHTELWLGLGLLGIILLLFFFWPNMKIIYTYHQPDGSLRKVIRYKRVFAPRNNALKVDVKDADMYEVTLGRWLTRSVRGGSLTIHSSHHSGEQFSANIPKEEKDRFTTHF